MSWQEAAYVVKSTNSLYKTKPKGIGNIRFQDQVVIAKNTHKNLLHP